MFSGMFGALGGGFFDQNFRAYPVAFIEKESAESGDKVILPPSSLNKLASMHVEYPMLFRVENKRGQRVSHCGVLEFIAQEGMCYMPQWMMDNMLLSVGELVNLKNVSLPKGSFIKIQPHTSDFLDISDPKAVLETSLRSFTCLTQGDTIAISYNGKNYHIDVMEVKPDRAVSVVETDISVDFAPPKDYKEPDYRAQSAAAAVASQPAAPAAAPAGAAAAGPGTEAAEPEPPRFAAFTGRGNRIDGKVPTASTSTAAAAAAPAPAAPARQTTGGLKSGTHVFGEAGAPAGEAPGMPGNRLAARRAAKAQGNGRSVAAPPKAEEKPKEEEEPKFKPFQGPGRSLKD
eukprot:jgi/Ulvmu1/2277/UM013_0124.1